MINKKIFFLLLLNISTLFASMIGNMGGNNTDNSYFPSQQNSNVFGKYIPYLQLPDSIYVQRKRFELNTYNIQRIYRLYFKLIYKRKKVLSNTLNMFILKTPAIKILKPVSHIYVNPVYIQQIILPKQYKITNAIASTSFDVFKFQNNEIHFKAHSNFEFGNIIIYYTNGHQNYSMNIIVDNYFQKQCFLLDKKYFCKKTKKINKNNFAFSLDNFALIYHYVNLKPLNSLEVIELYQKLTNKKITLIKNNNFVSFNYKNITYFIYRNDKFGNIIIDNKKFFVKP